MFKMATKKTTGVELKMQISCPNCDEQLLVEFAGNLPEDKLGDVTEKSMVTVRVLKDEWKNFVSSLQYSDEK